MLVDHQIKGAIDQGKLIIEPWDIKMLQPASVDLTLDSHFRIYSEYDAPIDPRSVIRRTNKIEVPLGGTFTLEPHGFALASTEQRVSLADNLIGKLEGKSSLARMGLFVHVTAGFFDPGFSGYCTLELFNAAPYPIVLIPGMPICQMGFSWSASQYDARTNAMWSPPAAFPYKGKYTNQPRGPQESKYHKNFDAES